MMWTLEQDNQLRAMHAEMPRPTCAKMGDRLGVSKNAVIGRRQRIGLGGSKRVAKPRNRTPNRRKAEPQISMQRMAMLKAEPVSANIAPIGAKSLIDLAPGECHWPFGNGPYRFCGCRAVTGQPYCAGHARIAYGRVVVVRARTKVSRFGNWATGTAE